MVRYEEAIAKLKNTQLNKLKSVGKNKEETILRLNKKNFEDKELPHELFLTTRPITNTRTAFANNISTDIKLSKAQVSEMIQSGWSFGYWLANLGKKVLANVPIPLARHNLPGLVSYLASSAINEFERKISGKEMSEQKKDLPIYFK